MGELALMLADDTRIVPQNRHISMLWKVTEESRRQVLNHPIYSSLTTLDGLRTFMEIHVFAVWDFMSLLKSLQQALTCVKVPWTPTGDRTTRRLINEIVLAEESDRWGNGAISHFEMYLAAMEEAGADIGAVSRFIAAVSDGQEPLAALQFARAPQAAADFVATTWAVLSQTPIHCQAAAFAFAREDLIPHMFERVLKSDEGQGRLGTFQAYLERHISIDGEEHMPMAMAMVAEICGDHHAKWDACARTVTASIKARSRLWDGVVEAIGAGADPATIDDSSPLPPLDLEGPTSWRARRRQRRADMNWGRDSASRP
jgi:hypothetical protein